MTADSNDFLADLKEAPKAFDRSAAADLSKRPTHIVCIGASAGGLEPIESVISSLKEPSPAAYVVVQHLSPDFKSLMDELLGRVTNIPVRKVEDGMEIEANTIYLIPPRKEMVVSGGQLLLSDQDVTAAGPPLPINSFMRSLAEEMQDQAIAIILSGSGSDGTWGARHVAEAGGTVFVQRPDTAAFDSMPTSVVRSGINCTIMTPQEIALELLDIVGSMDQPVAGAGQDDHADPIDRIMRALTENYGLDLRHYKTSTVHRRITRRRELTKSTDLNSYANMIECNGDERERLYFDLLINVTSYFRDNDAFRAIEADVFPEMLSDWDDSRAVRLWVPACATGEEAYSLAILLADYLRQHSNQIEFSIFATDVHRRSIDIASAGIYQRDQLQGLTQAQIDENFEVSDDQLKVKPCLRKRIVFSRHDILKDPPFTKMDLVSCRNLLIYFNAEAQRIALSRLHFALNKNGYLFMGTSESLGEFENEFDVLSARWRIFRKRRQIRFVDLALPAIDITRPFAGNANRSRRSAGELYNQSVYQNLVETFVPGGFLVNASGKLVHIFGAAGGFLELGEGKVTGHLQELLPEHLRGPVSTGIQKTISAKHQVVIRAHNKEKNETTPLCIHPMGQRTGQFEHFFVAIEEPHQINGGVTFDVPAEDAVESTTRLQELELELSSTEETLQTMIEELQASNEELQASNEELQSTNEELHSVNEKLFTVSAEHQEKVNELTALSYDMDNLLKSLNLPLVFLNERLEVRRFTPLASELYFFSSYDIGRPIRAIRQRFKLETLERDLDDVLNARQLISRKVEDDFGNELILRLQPYLTDPETCMGVIMIFFEADDIAFETPSITKMAI